MNDQAARMSESTLVWYYEFNDQDPPPEVGIDLNLGAYHSGELQYLYGFFDRTDGTPKQSRALNAAERRLSTEMIGYWGAFAAKGNPNHRGALRWPRFDPDAPRVLRFQPDDTVVVDSFDADHHCGFWRDLGVPLGLPAPLGLP
jgi:para-nitrobenzyl esterase